MSRIISPDDVIRHMEVPGTRGLFIVGCFENRVTLLSQQVRALNLVYALRQCGRLSHGRKVAVIGGGAAGMTAAAAAARVGCEVTLLEKKEALLPLLRGNTTRWLHPHIYDWPHESTERSEAGLPLLSWTAGLARDVVMQLEQEWDALPERPRIQTVFSVESVDVQSEGQGPRRLVSWNAPGLSEDTFDAVLLTVGFGLERKVEGIQWNSYWDNDRLHQPARGSSERHLISGCGDGGLVELLRVRLRDFRHEAVLQDFVSSPLLGSLKSKLLEIEERAKHESDASAYIFREYKALPVPDVLDEAIRKRLRRDTSAVLNGLGPRPLTLQSSILNRLLVSRLVFRFEAPYRQGEFSLSREGEHYKVQFKTGKAETFSHVTCRHGPHPSALEEEFKDIWKKSESMRVRSELDQTRWPIWPDGFFGGVPAAGAGHSKATASQPASALDERPLSGSGHLHAGTSAELAGKSKAADQVFVASPEPRNNSEIAGPMGGGRESPTFRPTVDGSKLLEAGMDSCSAVKSGQPQSSSISESSRSVPGKGQQEHANMLASQPHVLRIAEQQAVPTPVAKNGSPVSERTEQPISAKNIPSRVVVSCVLATLGCVWYVSWSGTQVSGPGAGPVHPPVKSVTPSPGGSVKQPEGEVGPIERELGRVGRTESVKANTRLGSRSLDAKALTSSSPGGDVAFAGGDIRTLQQLRSFHRVRALQQGGEFQSLNYLPTGVFAFVEPSRELLSQQLKVLSVQSANGFEVHRLESGRLHVVGYVWDVESRAIGTGRSTNVVLSPRPFGRSQSLVSIPVERVRSVDVRDEQGQIVMALELGASSEM